MLVTLFPGKYLLLLAQGIPRPSSYSTNEFLDYQLLLHSDVSEAAFLRSREVILLERARLDGLSDHGEVPRYS